MNFKEFEELINSGEKEITLTEDVIISDEDKGKSFEISFDEDDLKIDGNNHEFVSHNRITLNFNGRFFILKNLSFKNESPDSVFNFNSGAHLDNVSFDYNCIIYNNGNLHVENSNFSGERKRNKLSFFNKGDAEFRNSNVSNLINDGEVYLYKCNLNKFHNSGVADFYYCTMQFYDSFINEKKLKIYNSIFLNNGKEYHLKNEGYLKISCSVFKNFEIKGSIAIIQNEKGVIKLRDTSFEESYCRYSGVLYNQKGYVISNILGYVDAYNCKFINETYRGDIKGIYNVGASLILDSCEFKGIDEKLIHNANKTVYEVKLNEDGELYGYGELYGLEEKIEYSSGVLLKNCKYEDYNNIVTDNDNIFTLDESMPVIKKIKECKYLSELIHSGHKEIKLDNYFQLENRISIDVDDLVIDGCGNTIETIRNGIFDIKSDNVTLKNIKFINADYLQEESGGAIRNYGKNLKIIDCHFESNVSSIEGGAIHNRNGTIHIQNTVFKENAADFDKNGGAIANIDGEIILENCEFIGNESGRDGGAIYNKNGSLYISVCNFLNNYTAYHGKPCCHVGNAICNLNGTVNIENSNLDNRNYNDFYNSGILNIFNSHIIGDILNTGCLSIKKCQFEKGSSIANSALIYIFKSEEEYLNNFIEKNGGRLGISGFAPLPNSYMVGGTGKIRYLDELYDGENKNDFNYLNDLINFNSQNNDSLEIHLDSNIINKDEIFENGIEISEMKLVIDGKGYIIDANRKSGIFNISSAEVTLRNIIFKNSYTEAINISNANITLENCIFESNDSVKSGGSLNIKDTSLKAIDCAFIDNFASQGGAIYGKHSSIELLGCEFSKNSAVAVGAAISLDKSDLVCLKSNFNNNIAQHGAACRSHHSNLSFHDCEIKKNLGYNGAAIATSDSCVKFEECNFEKNKSKDSSILYGRELNDMFIIKKSKFIHNQTKRALILMADGYGRLYCSECKFENNDIRSNLIKVRQLYLSGCDFRNNQHGNELINVSEFLLGDDDDYPESKIKAEQVIENVNTEIDFKNLIDSGQKDISLKSDYIFFEDGKLDADGVCIDGQMHEIAGNMTITGKKITLKNIKFNDTVKIENNGTATLENCSFESYKKEVIINKANLTLKYCYFKEKHKILNTGEVTLREDDGTEVLTDEIIELYDEEALVGLRRLFEKPRKKKT
jgi:predicted outer membrane repeat protein